MEQNKTNNNSSHLNSNVTSSESTLTNAKRTINAALFANNNSNKNHIESTASPTRFHESKKNTFNGSNSSISAVKTKAANIK